MISLNISATDKEYSNNDKQEEKDKKEEKDELRPKTFVEVPTADT
jgi:hypothetical protein